MVGFRSIVERRAMICGGTKFLTRPTPFTQSRELAGKTQEIIGFL